MLGQPISMLIPQVVGFRLTGALPEGATATDLVLTVTADAAQDGRRRQVRRVLRRRASPALPLADRATIGEHVAGVRRDVRLLPGRRRDAPLPAPDRPQRGAGRARRGVLQGERALARRRRAARPTRRSSSSTSRPSSRRSPARAARRTACRCARRRQSFLEALPTFGVDYGNGARQGDGRLVPGERPAAEGAPGTARRRARRRTSAPVAVADRPAR